LIDELEVRLVRQGGCLQGRLALPPLPLVVGLLAKFGVNPLVEIATGLLFTILKTTQQPCSSLLRCTVHWPSPPLKKPIL